LITAVIKLPDLKAGKYVEKYAEQAWTELAVKDPQLFRKLRNARTHVWHHASDGSLQLIDEDLHTAFAHTGLNAVLKNSLASLGVALVPGLAKLKEGEVNAAGREVVVSITPLAFLEMGVDGYGAFLEECQRETAQSPEQKARVLTGSPSSEEHRAAKQRFGDLIK